MNTILEHLKQRYLDIDLHKPMIDEVERLATFYLYNLSGQIVGYQQYRPEGEKKPQNNPKLGKYYTYRKQPTVSVWGVESLHLSPDVVFVTEGLFDAARLTSSGVSALAMFSNNPSKDVRNWLMCLGRTVVTVCDNDKAGKQLAKFGHYSIFTEDKDLGDSSEEFVSELILKFKK